MSNMNLKTDVIISWKLKLRLLFYAGFIRAVSNRFLYELRGTYQGISGAPVTGNFNNQKGESF